MADFLDIDYELLSAYLDGELSANERIALEQRLATDSELAAVLADMQVVQQAVASLPIERAPRDFRLTADMIAAPITTAQPAKPKVVAMPPRTPWWTAAAAALAFVTVGVGAVVLNNRDAAPQSTQMVAAAATHTAPATLAALVMPAQAQQTPTEEIMLFAAPANTSQPVPPPMATPSPKDGIENDPSAQRQSESVPSQPGAADILSDSGDAIITNAMGGMAAGGTTEAQTGDLFETGLSALQDVPPAALEMAPMVAQETGIEAESAMGIMSAEAAEPALAMNDSADIQQTLVDGLNALLSLLFQIALGR